MKSVVLSAILTGAAMAFVAVNPSPVQAYNPTLFHASGYSVDAPYQHYFYPGGYMTGTISSGYPATGYAYPAYTTIYNYPAPSYPTTTYSSYYYYVTPNPAVYNTSARPYYSQTTSSGYYFP